jgi:hypothetical protein
MALKTKAGRDESIRFFSGTDDLTADCGKHTVGWDRQYEQETGEIEIA